MCDGYKVNIYDGRTSKITVSEEAVLKGWRFPRTKLWRIPLRAQVTDLNIHTLILHGPTGYESLNLLYNVPPSAYVMDYIELFNNDPACPEAGEAINNVYELPTLEHAVRYLHAAAGFSTKAMCIKIIRNGNYLTWPLITVHNVNNHFLESEETQKGHMRNQ